MIDESVLSVKENTTQHNIGFSKSTKTLLWLTCYILFLIISVYDN